MRWGLVPPWAKAAPDGTPENKGPLLINARAETVTTSPAFRSSARSKRCLVPMDGYYEWKPNPDTPAGKKARKTPFYMYRADGEPLFMAGLWSVWRSGQPGHDVPLLSCTIITTDAVGELAEIHDRMPLVVNQRDWDRWLDPDAPAAADLLAAPPDISGIDLREVSTLVNNVRNNGPELIEPAPPHDVAAADAALGRVARRVGGVDPQVHAELRAGDAVVADRSVTPDSSRTSSHSSECPVYSRDGLLSTA